MNRYLRSTVFLLFVVSFIGCDQISKKVARDVLSDSPAISCMNDVVHLEYAENTGSFMGLGADLPHRVRLAFHTATALIVLIGAIVLLINIQKIGRARLIGFAFLLAGACGNLVDRFLNNGRVIDFVVIGIDSLRTGIFNVADLLIAAGALLLLLSAHSRSAASSSESPSG